MKNIIALIFAFGCTLSAYSQIGVLWQKTHGGNSQLSQGISILELSSGGYFALMNGSESCYGAGASMWLYRLDENGNTLWQRCYGGSGHERPMSFEYGATLIETHEGGILLSCQTASNNSGDVYGNHGSTDIWVAKLTQDGNVVWARCYGGYGGENGSPNAVKTPDGGYVLTGNTLSNNSGDVSGYKGNGDVWTFKIDGDGELLWQRCSGGSNNEWGLDIVRATNSTGGYVVVGNTNSNNHDVSGFAGERDFWVFRLNESGTMSWRRTYGGSGLDRANSILSTDDGGYIVVGSTSSTSGQVAGNNGGHDAWVIKISQTGLLLWQKCIGTIYGDAAFSVVNSHSGGYLILGRTTTNSAQNSGAWHSWSTSWVAKIDESGNLLWQEPVGQEGVPSSPGLIRATSDGGYLVVDAIYASIEADGSVVPAAVSKMRVTKFFEAGNPLPLGLLYFNVRPIEVGVGVFWKVAPESGHVRFELLRGVDPGDLRQIDAIEAVVAPVAVTYEAFDTNPFPGVSYYQLRQVFQDGSTKLTDIVSIYNETEDHFFQEGDSVGLRGERSRMFDAIGRPGAWNDLHNLGLLPSGVYLIQGEVSGKTFKFFKP